MASIDDLVRPKADFDPETITVLCAALDEAWDRLLQSGSECTRPLCPCYARGRGAAHHRYGATGHQGSNRACQRRASFSCCELST